MAAETAPVLERTIFQARYKPSLGFYENMRPAAIKLSDYPDWETSGVFVKLKNIEKHCSVGIYDKLFAYDQNSSDEELEETRIADILDVVPAGLGIKSLTRLGYRRIYVAPFDAPFGDLVRIMNTKFYSGDKGLRRIIPGNITDLMYRIDSSDECNSYHVTVGPVKRDEMKINGFLPADHPNLAAQAQDGQTGGGLLPEVGVYIDFDVYRERDSLPVETASSFFHDGKRIAHEFATELCAHLTATGPRS